MTNQHPITPPREVVDRLFMIYGSEEDRVIAAYRAGADQELDACCAEMNDWGNIHHSCGLDLSNFLRTARRPKPPSLKEQALAALDDAVMRGDCMTISDALPTIRRALEALPND